MSRKSRRYPTNIEIIITHFLDAISNETYVLLTGANMEDPGCEQSHTGKLRMDPKPHLWHLVLHGCRMTGQGCTIIR